MRFRFRFETGRKCFFMRRHMVANGTLERKENPTTCPSVEGRFQRRSVALWGWNSPPMVDPGRWWEKSLESCWTSPYNGSTSRLSGVERPV